MKEKVIIYATPTGHNYFYDLYKKEIVMAALKRKHVSFANQREQCRLNKFTYEEKCASCGTMTLMCNYPFPDPTHRKGVCRANTCTDMRKTLADDLAAISGAEEPVVVEMTKAPEIVVEKEEAAITLPEDSHVAGENDSARAGDTEVDEAVVTEKTEDLPKGAVRAE